MKVSIVFGSHKIEGKNKEIETKAMERWCNSLFAPESR